MTLAEKSTLSQDFASPVKMPPSKVEVKPYGKWGRYHIRPKGAASWAMVPSVTRITSQLDKSAPLMYWSAGQAVDYLVEEIFMPIIDYDFDIPDELKQKIRDIAEEEPKEVYKEAKRYHKKKAEEAAEIGTLTHLRILQWFSGYKEKPLAPELLIPFEAFLKWAEEWRPQPIHLEKIVGSTMGGGYGGRIDFIGYIQAKRWKKPRLFVLDFKATGGIYKEDPLQVAGYGYAWAEMYHLIDGTGILRLDKKTGMPEFKYWGRQESRNSLSKFKSLLEYWHKENKKV